MINLSLTRTPIACCNTNSNSTPEALADNERISTKNSCKDEVKQRFSLILQYNRGKYLTVYFADKIGNLGKLWSIRKLLVAFGCIISLS